MASATILDQLYLHAASCVSRPTTAPECADFWSAWIFGCFALGSLAMLFLVWKSTFYSIQFHSVRLVPLELERAIAGEPMSNLRWVGGQAFASEAAGDELEDCIRAALAQVPLAELAREEVLSKAA